mmetsp:Transcript_2184/g.8629  ORF Transcript_2184/g.8629 Transcript_2184/m.8629 type:complete len:264 (+) Transcript_2184:603-1394(+)
MSRARCSRARRRGACAWWWRGRRWRPPGRGPCSRTPPSGASRQKRRTATRSGTLASTAPSSGRCCTRGWARASARRWASPDWRASPRFRETKANETTATVRAAPSCPPSGGGPNRARGRGRATRTPLATTGASTRTWCCARRAGGRRARADRAALCRRGGEATRRARAEPSVAPGTPRRGDPRGYPPPGSPGMLIPGVSLCCCGTRARGRRPPPRWRRERPSQRGVRRRAPKPPPTSRTRRATPVLSPSPSPRRTPRWPRRSA